MPSFGVNNSHPFSLDDTYRRYLPIPLHFGRRGSYDLNHRNMKKTCRPTSIFMIAFVFLCCISMSWSFCFEYFLYNQPTIYNDYYLYYFNYSFIITARLSFLFLWTRIFPILPSTKSIIQKCQKFSVTFIILIASVSIGIVLTNLWYQKLNDDVVSNDALLIPTHENDPDSTLCSQIFQCRLTDSLSFYALFIQFALIFLIFITFCIHSQQFDAFREKQIMQIVNPQRTPQRKRRKSRRKRRRKSRKKAAIALLETRDDDSMDIIRNAEEYKSDEDDLQENKDSLTVELNDSVSASQTSSLQPSSLQPSSSQQQSQSQDVEMDDNVMTPPYLMLYDDDDFENNKSQQLQSPTSFKAMKLKILLLQIGSFVVFLILWTMHYLFGILHENFIKNHFLKLYICFVVLWAICKVTLKSFARKLDGLRVGNVATSFEYLCEFYCCAMYWILFRQYIVYHVAVNDEYLYNFIIILCIHLLMELYCFLGRASDWYFDNTNDLLHELQQRPDRFYDWIYRKLHDDSNVYQWRTRLSFDLIIRINICLVTGVIQQIYLVLMIPSFYSTIYTDYVNIFDNGFNDEMFIKAMIYNGSSVIAEIFLYLITMILVYKWYWINIWESFENMVNGTMGNRVIMLYWMICLVSIY